jgi:hypothetical protein
MSSTVIGTATVFALDGVTVAFTSPAVSTGVVEPTNIALDDAHAASDLTDRSGQIVAGGFTTRKQTLTITVFFQGNATRANAAAAWKVPDIGSLVTLAGFGNGMIDGSWNYDGQFSPTFSSTGFGSATMRLARRGATATAAMSLVT